MPDEIFVQRRFTITADDGTVYSDAITLPQAEYDDLSEAAIKRLQKQRYKDWQQAVADASNAPPPPLPTTEEILDGLDQQRDQLSQQIDMAVANEGIDAEPLVIALDAVDIAIQGVRDAATP